VWQSCKDHTPTHQNGEADSHYWCLLAQLRGHIQPGTMCANQHAHTEMSSASWQKQQMLPLDTIVLLDARTC